jgi:hypothetical protein
MKITVSNKNKVGRVTFGKVAKVGAVSFSQINDINVSGQQDGDILVYQANTSTYVVQALPKVDGGTY